MPQLSLHLVLPSFAIPGNGFCNNSRVIPDIVRNWSPKPNSLSVDELAETAQSVTAKEGKAALQATTEGHPVFGSGFQSDIKPGKYQILLPHEYIGYKKY